MDFNRLMGIEKIRYLCMEHDGMDAMINYFLMHAPAGEYGKNEHSFNNYKTNPNFKLFELIGELKVDKTETRGIYTHKRKAKFTRSIPKKEPKTTESYLNFRVEESNPILSTLNIDSIDQKKSPKFSMWNTCYDICTKLVYLDLYEKGLKYSDVGTWIINNFPFQEAIS